MKQFSKKILSVMTALLMLLPFFCFSTSLYAEDPGLPAAVKSGIWDGSIADAFAGGDGTQSSPYLISNGAELAYLSTQVNSGNNFSDVYFKLTDNICLNDISSWEDWGNTDDAGNTIAPSNTWTAIGFYSLDWNTGVETKNFFSGYFDGSGKTISGVYINKSPDDFDNSNHLGLFGYINGTIENLKVESSFIRGCQNIGAIAGWSEGTLIGCSSVSKVFGSCCGGVAGWNDGIIEECSNNHDIDGMSNVGGVVGYCLNQSKVKNCSNIADISGDDAAGGVIGNNCGYMAGCINHGNINAAGNAGGITGFNEGSVYACTNDGTINGDNCTGGIAGMNYGGITDCVNSGNITGNTNAGGICGTNSSDVSICRNNGAVTGSERIGGIAGCNNSSIYACCNNACVNGTSYIGGIIGFNSQATVSDCYNTNTVTGNSNVGGVAGSNLSIEQGPGGAMVFNGTVQRSYNIGSVNGSDNFGGVIGYNYYTDDEGNDYNGTVENCYYLLGCCTMEDPSSIVLTSEQMCDASSFTGFDFEKVWTMEGSADYPYPEIGVIFDVSFEDGYTHEIIPGGGQVPAGTVLDEADFPEPPVHEGCIFKGWSYDGLPVYSDTVIRAIYEDPNAAKLNCFIVYNPNGASSIWAEFSALYPAGIENHGEMLRTSAAAFAGGNVYGYLFNEFGEDTRFYVMDPDTYEVTYSSYNSGHMVYAMAYDHAGGAMYAISDNESGMKALYKVNLATGILEYIADIDAGGEMITTLAIDGEGNAYGISNSMNDAMLWNIDLATGAAASIGGTGKALSGDSSIVWDHNSGKIFWTQFNDDNDNGLLIVDPATGSVNECGKIDKGVMAVCLWSENDLPIAPIEAPKFNITFISGVTNEEIPGGYSVDAGTVLDPNDFPVPPVYDGCEFLRWSYDNQPIYADTEIKAIYSFPDSATINGFIYDTENFSFAWGTFPEYDPSTVELHPSMNESSAAAFAGGKVYGYLFNGEFYTMDPDTFEIVPSGYNTGANIFGMAYDHSRETMYAIGEENGGPRSLYKVNLALGCIEKVAPLDADGATIMTFAVDTDGNGYGLSLSEWGDNGVSMSRLYGIDLETGVCTMIADMGIRLQFLQSMTWDHNTDRLFWAQYADEQENGLYIIDPVTGDLTSCGKIGNGYEVRSLWIADELPTAPVVPPDFQITFIDGMTGEEIPGGFLVEGGNVLDPADFPVPPVHENCEFIGWNYGGEPIYHDTVIKAIYSFPGAAMLNGYITYDPSGDYGIWGRFAEYAPGDVENMAAFDYTYAAAYANGNVYGYLMDGRFYVMDAETFETTIMDSMTEDMVYAMAYDEKNETMYALVQSNMDGSRSLNKVELSTGAFEPVANVNAGGKNISTLAIDGEGNGYGLTEGADAELYRIDLTNGECTFIGTTGVALNFVQSMVWDPNSGRIFWAQFNNENDNGLYIIDPVTAEASFCGKIGGGAEVTCLWIAANDQPDPSEPIPGDFDGDGIVTVEDALMILRCALELYEPSEEEFIRADFDGNGIIETEDAILALRAAVNV